MTTNNTYFAELDQIARAFDEKRRAHEAKKQQILDTYGWDSEELNAWYREKEEMAYPISEGACKAFRAFRMSDERETAASSRWRISFGSARLRISLTHCGRPESRPSPTPTRARQ